MYVFSARNSTKPKRLSNFPNSSTENLLLRGGIQFEWQKLSAWMDVSSDYMSGSFARNMLSLRLSKHFAKTERASPGLGDGMKRSPTFSQLYPLIIYIYARMYVHTPRLMLRHTPVLVRFFLTNVNVTFLRLTADEISKIKVSAKRFGNVTWSSYIIINLYHSTHLSNTIAAFTVAMINAQLVDNF